MAETLKKILFYLPDKLIDLLWLFEVWRTRRGARRYQWPDALPKKPVLTDEAMREILREAVENGKRRGYLPAESEPAK